MKPIKAWAVTDPSLRPCGNGTQWQYPVFMFNREAVAFSRESHGFSARTRVVRVEIRELPRKRRAK